jgi:hypothetical protein
VGRVYQQTVIDTYAKVGFAKLYDRKTPITAAEILNDRVVPFYDEHAIRLSRMLTDRGTEFCGSQSHEYELYLAVEDIDHTTRCPRWVERRDDPDYCGFAIGSIFRRTDQPSTQNALLIANWHGTCRPRIPRHRFDARRRKPPEPAKQRAVAS